MNKNQDSAKRAAIMCQRLKKLRKESNLTQQELSKMLWCHKDVYRKYEKGTRQIPLDVLIRLATIYNVSADYILGLTN